MILKYGCFAYPPFPEVREGWGTRSPSHVEGSDVGLGLSGQGAEDVLQDASVFVVEDFLRGVDAHLCEEGLCLAIAALGLDGEDFAVGELCVQQVAEAGEVVDLFAG